MEFDFSKYKYGFYSRSFEIAQDLHEFSKTCSKQEFLNAIDELVSRARD